MRSLLMVVFAPLLISCDDPVVTPPATVDTVDTVVVDETPLGVGELVITEVMVNSISCRQYVEIFNRSGRVIDLTEVRVGNGLVDVAVLSGALEAGAYGWGAVATTEPACRPTAPTFTMDDISFSYDAGAKVVLLAGTTLLDQVVIGGWPDLPGAAWSVDRGKEDATSNDNRASWCQADAPIGTSEDKGTPGGINTDCVPGVIPKLPPLTLAEVAVGALVINEVLFSVDRCDGPGQAVEIANTSDRDVILDGLVLSDGTDLVRLATGDMIVNAHSFVTLAGASAADSCVSALYVPDAWWGDGVRFDSGDLVAIGRGDPVEVLDSVPTGSWLVTEGCSMQLANSGTDVVMNDLGISWCPSQVPFAGSAGSFGSLGIGNAGCIPGQTAPPRMGDDLEVGDVVITEVLLDPLACVDYKGQYFEIVNLSHHDLDLKGLTVAVDGDAVTLSKSYRIARDAIALALFANNGNPPACYPGLVGDFFWDTANFQHDGSRIDLFSGLIVVDSVNLGGLGPGPGVALQLDPAFQNHRDNDGGSHWCPSVDSPPNLIGDFGSPTTANHPCATVGGDDTADTGIAVVPVDALTVDELVPGDLVVTEIMPDPVDCADFAAEYIEVRNVSGAAVNPTGLRVSIGGGVDTVFDVQGDVADGAWFTLRYSTGSPPGCYGFTGQALYGTAKMADTGTSVALRNAFGVLDDVPATGWGIFAPGVAGSLDPRWLTAAGNDDVAHWCASPSTFAGAVTDRGSPAAGNAVCAGVPPP